MAFAKGFSSFDEKTFAFKILLAKGAVKALTMIIVIQSFDPAVTSLDWKATRDTLCCEQFIPIFFAVGQAVFQVEWRVGEDFSTISANKTLGMKCFAHGLQTILHQQHSKICLAIHTYFFNSFFL